MYARNRRLWGSIVVVRGFRAWGCGRASWMESVSAFGV